VKAGLFRRRVRRPSAHAGGFTYLALLFFLAIMSVTALAVSYVASVQQRREREVELLFRGDAYRNAIRAYHNADAKSAAPYPTELAALLRDPNRLETRRYLRRLYPDPMTDGEWGLVRDTHGGIRAVFSLAPGTPLKQSGFDKQDAGFSGAKSYADWLFGAAKP
jgi:type II secretory pathway pseudopilin PulG